MVKEQKSLADYEQVYLYLNCQVVAGGGYYPFLYEIEEKKFLAVFTSKVEIDKAAEQMRDYMDLPIGEKLYIGKIGRKEELAIYLEFCLHGGKTIQVDIAGSSEEIDCIDILNDLYEKLGHQRLFTEKNREFPSIMEELYRGGCNFYTLPSVATRGEQIMNNEFMPIREGKSILFFADEESAIEYYTKSDLPIEWNIKSDFKQVIPLLLFSYEHNVKTLVIYKEECRTEIELQLAFWLIQKIARTETYLLIPREYAK